MAVYEFIGSDYAIPDFNVAEQNMRRARADCEYQRRAAELNSTTTEEVAAALRAYRVCRERLLSIQPHVEKAAGHKHFPETPEGFENFDTPTKQD